MKPSEKIKVTKNNNKGATINEFVIADFSLPYLNSI